MSKLSSLFLKKTSKLVAIVCAGSVATGDIPVGAIAVGVPARVVRMRNSLG